MYFRLSIGGKLGATELWTINPAFDPQWESSAATWDQEAGEAMVLAAAGVTPGAQILSAISSAADISTFRLEGRSDAHALLGVAEYRLPTPYPGSGAPTKPAQSAMVLSLRTNTPGASGRGRLFLPSLNVPIDTTTLRLSSTTVTNLIPNVVTYLRGVQDAMRDAGSFFPWTSLNLCVVSRTTGQRPLVNRIQIGDVIDVQRRRRDAIRETYQARDFPGSP